MNMDTDQTLVGCCKSTNQFYKKKPVAQACFRPEAAVGLWQASKNQLERIT